MPFRLESLDSWHMARDHARKVYALTARFPRHEDYGLRSQMNRACNSISLDIAEGSAKGTDEAFDYYLVVAIGSAFEVVAASFHALDNQYISDEAQRQLYREGQEPAKSIHAFRGTLAWYEVGISSHLPSAISHSLCGN